MKKLSKLICENALLVCIGIAVSPINSGATLLIEERYFMDAEMFFVGDFDLQRLQNNPKIFEIAAITDDPKGTIAWLEFSVSTDVYGQLLWAKTDTFMLENERSITSFDFDKSGSLSYPDIKVQDYDLDLEGATTLKEAVLATGEVPTGIYSFTLRIEEYDNPSNYDILFKTITVTNPTVVDLLTPGRIPEDKEVILTTYPRFQWESLANKFQLTVCEKLPEDLSPQEVMNKLPHYQVVIENQSFWEYPTAGARLLESGHTYYWQVQALVPTSGGIIEIESEIWGFTILGKSELNELLVEIEGLLTEHYGGILNKLQNYSPTGEITIEGMTISIDELRSYFEGFRSGKYKITSLNVK